VTFSPRLSPTGSTVRIARPAAAFGLAVALAAAGVIVGAQSKPRKIYTSLVDKKGVPVTTVTPADLVVREDGVAREILSVTPATDPMRIALLVDNSQAATDSIQFLREGLNGFAKRLTTAGHSIALVTLGDRPTLQVDATTDFTRLKSRGIDRLFAQPGSGMYLLEALIDTSKGFVKNETPRPVIVAVITEGKEFSNASAENVIKAIHDSGAQRIAVARSPQRRHQVRLWVEPADVDVAQVQVMSGYIGGQGQSLGFGFTHHRDALRGRKPAQVHGHTSLADECCDRRERDRFG